MESDFIEQFDLSENTKQELQIIAHSHKRTQIHNHW